jgi:predicted transcriptional regulator
MIEQLFGSKTRAKLLQLFLSNPNRSFYVREITRKIDEQINSVRRELANLSSIGIITSDTTNNRLYYEVNQKYLYYEPLAEIFGGKTRTVTKKPSGSKKSSETKAPSTTEEIKKTADLHPLVEQLTGNAVIEVIVLTGQFTRDESAGVDVLVVGDISSTVFNKVMADFEESEGKVLKYSLFDIGDFTYRMQVNDRFISDILLAKKQVLLDKTGRIK